MGLQVFDTYVKLPDGSTDHIDILMPEGKSKDEAIVCGTEYMKGKGVSDFTLTTEECRFCHITEPSEEQNKSVEEKGYAIIQM